MGLRIRQARNVQVRVAVVIILAVMAYPIYVLTLHGVYALTGPKVEIVTPEGSMQHDLKVHVKVSDDHLSRVKFTVERLSDGEDINTSVVQPDEGQTSLELEDYDPCAHDRLGKCDVDWVTDGAYEIRVLAYASDGTRNISTHRKVIVDTEKPTAVFISPEDWSVGDDLVIGAELHDNQEVARYGFDISGPNGLSFSTKDFETDKAGVSLKDFDLCGAAEEGICPAELPDGQYSIRAKVTDGAGNQELDTRLQRIIDRKAPLVSMDSVGSPFSGSTSLTGAARDEGSGLETESGQEIIHLTFYNAAGDDWSTTVPVNNGTWGYRFDTLVHSFFKDGDYRVVAQASDKQGRSDLATRYFTVDNTAPAVSIRLTSKPTMMASSGPIMLAGKAGRDTASLKLFLNGDPDPIADLAPGTQGKWNYEMPKENVVMGTYTFTVVATDSYGNVASRTLAPVSITPFVPGQGAMPTNLVQPLADTYIVPHRLSRAGATAPFTAKTGIQGVLGTETAKDPTGSDGIAAITTSQEGWKFFGVAWYWWTLFGAAGVGVTWQSLAWARRRGDQLM